MKATCLKENLGRGLSITGGAIAGKTAMPILQNVLMEARDGKLKLSGTNLETTITTWTDAEVHEPGEAVVPARLFAEFVRSLPDGPIELEAEPGAGLLKITCGRAATNINTANPLDFPPIPTAGEGAPAASMDAQALRGGIQQVAFAASDSEARPVLTGVEVKLSGSSMVMAAADGFRLAVYRGILENPVEEDVSAVIPAKALTQVERLIRGQDGEVEIVLGDPEAEGGRPRQQAVFRIPGVEIVSQLLQGTFPAYEQLIPQESETRAVLDTKELQRAARSAEAFAKSDMGVTRLEIQTEGGGENEEGEKGKVTLSARSEETGDNQVEMEAEIDRGTGQRIAFNSRYLKEMLAAVGSDKLVLEADSSSSPGVFRSGESEEYTHVIMPMAVKWDESADPGTGAQ